MLLERVTLTSNFTRVSTQKLQNRRVQTCGYTRQRLKVIPWQGLGSQGARDCHV